jgi:hypothetical protein
MTQQHEEQVTTADIAGTQERDTTAADEDRAVSREHDEHGDPTATGRADGDLTPLFQEDERDDLNRRWQTLQTRFVDDPKTTVEEADQLVADLMQRLAESFAEERRSLESQWSRGDDVSTEDLRLALQRYRSFFERLLSA